MLYSRFYLALIAGAVACYYLLSSPSFPAVATFVSLSFWLPQIVASATSNTRPPYPAFDVVATSAVRAFLPLYLLGCPRSVLADVFQVPASGGAAALAVLWLAAQWLGPALGLPGRYAFLFDMAALAAFVWALVVTYRIWRARRDNQG